MEFLDKVKEIASEVATTSSKQSKKLYSIAKLNLEISDKQKKVKSLYKEIGFDAYKAYKAQSDITEFIKNKLEKIDLIEEEIAYLRKNIDDIKNIEEIGVEDIPTEDIAAEDAVVIEEQTEYDEAETEPIDPIE